MIHTIATANPIKDRAIRPAELFPSFAVNITNVADEKPIAKAIRENIHHRFECASNNIQQAVQ